MDRRERQYVPWTIEYDELDQLVEAAYQSALTTVERGATMTTTAFITALVITFTTYFCANPLQVGAVDELVTSISLFASFVSTQLSIFDNTAGIMSNTLGGMVTSVATHAGQGVNYAFRGLFQVVYQNIGVIGPVLGMMSAGVGGIIMSSPNWITETFGAISLMEPRRALSMLLYMYLIKTGKAVSRGGVAVRMPDGSPPPSPGAVIGPLSDPLDVFFREYEDVSRGSTPVLLSAFGSNVATPGNSQQDSESPSSTPPTPPGAMSSSNGCDLESGSFNTFARNVLVAGGGRDFSNEVGELPSLSQLNSELSSQLEALRGKRDRESSSGSSSAASPLVKKTRVHKPSQEELAQIAENLINRSVQTSPQSSQDSNVTLEDTRGGSRRRRRQRKTRKVRKQCGGKKSKKSKRSRKSRHRKTK